MPIEQYTENITLQSMKCNIGENDFGFVFPQGDVADVDKVNTPPQDGQLNRPCQTP